MLFRNTDITLQIIATNLILALNFDGESTNVAVNICIFVNLSETSGDFVTFAYPLHYRTAERVSI